MYFVLGQTVAGRDLQSKVKTFLFLVLTRIGEFVLAGTSPGRVGDAVERL